MKEFKPVYKYRLFLTQKEGDDTDLTERFAQPPQLSEHPPKDYRIHPLAAWRFTTDRIRPWAGVRHTCLKL